MKLQTRILIGLVGGMALGAAGIAFVTAIDRPLDMCRTAVNTFGNLVGAAWVATGVPREGIRAAEAAGWGGS